MEVSNHQNKNQSESLILPRRAVALDVLSRKLTENLTLGRNSAGLPTIHIAVSEAVYLELVRRSQGAIKSSLPVSSTDLYGWLRELAPQESKIDATGWDRLKRSRTTKSSKMLSLGMEDHLRVKAVLTYLSGFTNAPPAHAARVCVVDGIHPPLVGEPTESEALLKAEAFFARVLKQGPRKEYSDRWPSAVEGAQERLSVFKEALSLHSAGHTVAQIAKKIDVNPTTVSRWLDGQLPREVQDLGKFSETSHLEHFSIPIPVSSSPELAALGGSFQSSTWLKGSGNLTRLRFLDGAMALRVKSLLDTWGVFERLDLVEESTDRGCERNLKMSSKLLFRGLAELTKDNDQIPHQILGSEEEIIAYLRSYIALSGRVYHGKFTLQSSQHPALVIGIATLFEYLDIPTEVSDSGRMYFTVASAYGIARMLHHSLLTTQQRAALNQKLSKGEGNIHPCRAYDEMLKIRRENPVARPADIARALGIPYMTAISWNNGRIPRLVKAREALREWKVLLRIPKPMTVAFLHRELGIAVEEACVIGCEFTLSQLRDAATALRSGSVPLKDLRIDHLRRAIRKPLLG